ncbi:ABC transporter ATP-binding protein [Enterococcus sp. 8G7_MSG3316]|uniref:ABC transporter ATP-binding protein n=1 Tax=Candidatus Enterococcus testudinis TaxID=1834191 RepID=A0A242A765_9ENTE|nr:ATP-binding cassette domain-containing protein [Enterococcus sp. 8G7_MSG3316]OTN76453.1 ABC transporter ATP-binding protein [Enterococcus sp. 8G7_MSG3316]
MLQINKATKVVGNGPHEKKVLLNKVDLSLQPGEFVTVVGGNGAGKSTLFNSISGTLPLTSGQITIDDQDVTNLSEEKRARYLARVFQDPKMGTAPRMTVAENLLLAQKRGQKRNLHLRQLQSQRDAFYALCQQVGNGLENHLDTPTGNLSGGQRQALSLLMATIQTPKLLLLDEHTAALDPKTSKQLMQITADRVAEQQLTCLMITHRMDDALKYGNRLILLRKGEIVKDLSADEKAALSLPELLLFFEDDL